MTPEKMKAQVNRVLRYGFTEVDLAKHLEIPVKVLQRMKKGKLPPRYLREEALKKLNKTWVHYEQSGGGASLENRI